MKPIKAKVRYWDTCGEAESQRSSGVKQARCAAHTWCHLPHPVATCTFTTSSITDRATSHRPTASLAWCTSMRRWPPENRRSTKPSVLETWAAGQQTEGRESECGSSSTEGMHARPTGWTWMDAARKAAGALTKGQPINAQECESAWLRHGLGGKGQGCLTGSLLKSSPKISALLLASILHGGAAWGQVPHASSPWGACCTHQPAVPMRGST